MLASAHHFFVDLEVGDFGDDFSFEFGFCFDLELLVNPKLGITAHFNKVVPTALSEMCFTSKSHFHHFLIIILKGRVPWPFLLSWLLLFSPIVASDFKDITCLLLEMSNNKWTFKPKVYQIFGAIFMSKLPHRFFSDTLHYHHHHNLSETFWHSKTLPLRKADKSCKPAFENFTKSIWRETN